MTKIREIDPPAAHAALAAGGGTVLLDVRSQAEFATGHPPGAINIPLYDLDAQGMMAANMDFPHVVAAIVPPAATVIVACKVGQRSAQAAELMTAMGYGDVANLAGGIHGFAGFLGQTAAPGWIGCGLPVTHEITPEAAYPSLKARADEQAAFASPRAGAADDNQPNLGEGQ